MPLSGGAADLNRQHKKGGRDPPVILVFRKNFAEASRVRRYTVSILCFSTIIRVGGSY
jgi:hypothetical protein